MKKNKNAFTLAEVLITLAIIGVVAALTIPAMIQNTKKEELKNGLKIGYSIINQAYLKMLNDGYSPKDYIGNTNTFKPVYMQYFNVVKDCGVDGCVNSSNNPYKNLSKTATAASAHIMSGQFVLNNGMLIMIGNTISAWIDIVIDVNGVNKAPNIVGYDVFMFGVRDNILTPSQFGDGYWTQAVTCSTLPSATSADNGYSCTGLALTDPDYFKNLP